MMRKAKASAVLAAKKAAGKMVPKILKKADDGIFAVQSALSSAVLILMTAGYKLATQLHPPE